MSTDEQVAQPEYDRLAAVAIPGWCAPPRRPRNRAQLADAICQIMRHAQGASECEFCNGGQCSSLEATAVADLVLALGLQVEQFKSNIGWPDPARVSEALETAGRDFLAGAPHGSYEQWRHARTEAVINLFAAAATARERAAESAALAAAQNAAGHVADALCDAGNHSASAGAEAARKAISKLVLSELPVCWHPTHQHRKGGLYRVIARGSLEADLTPAVVYDDAEGRVWIRPAAEFDDGRFNPLSGEPR